MNEDSILQLIRTTYERSRLVNLIEHLQENIFKRTPDYSFLNSESAFIKNILDAIEKVLQARGFSNNRTATDKFLESLKEKAQNLDVFKITVAFDPTEKLVSDLKLWANKNSTPTTIFDISVDPHIQGGAIITNDQGEYVNYSLSLMLDKSLVNKKSELMALLQ
jgi:F0F1-type ATP synthase delta subunit